LLFKRRSLTVAGSKDIVIAIYFDDYGVSTVSDYYFLNYRTMYLYKKQTNKNE